MGPSGIGVLPDQVDNPVGGIRDAHAYGGLGHGLPAIHVAEEFRQFDPEPSTVDLLIGEDSGPAGVGQEVGIGDLVVVRSPRKRHQEGGHADHSELGHRRGSRPGEDQIGGNEGRGQVVLVLDDTMLDGGRCSVSNEVGGLPVPAAQDMVDDDLATIPVPHRLEHGPVDAACPQRAAEHHDEGPIVEPVGPTRCLTPDTGRALADLLSDGVPRHDRPWQPRAIRRYGARPGESAEEAIGRPGDCVLLGDDDRNPKEDGSQPTRDAGVAAQCNDDPGSPTQQEHHGTQAGQAQPEEGTDVGERQATLDATTRQEGEREAGRWNEGALDAAPATDEEHRVGPFDHATVDEGLRYGQAREDMPRSTTPCNHHPTPRPYGHGV